MKQVVCAVEDRAGEVRAFSTYHESQMSDTETGFVDLNITMP